MKRRVEQTQICRGLVELAGGGFTVSTWITVATLLLFIKAGNSNVAFDGPRKRPWTPHTPKICLDVTIVSNNLNNHTCPFCWNENKKAYLFYKRQHIQQQTEQKLSQSDTAWSPLHYCKAKSDTYWRFSALHDYISLPFTVIIHDIHSNEAWRVVTCYIWYANLGSTVSELTFAVWFKMQSSFLSPRYLLFHSKYRN